MKKGFALIMVLAVMLVIALGIAALLQAVGGQVNMKANNLQEVQAKYLAEAGMQYASAVCRANNGDCSSLNGFTLTAATTGFDHDINFTTTPAVAGAMNYVIQVDVQYVNV